MATQICVITATCRPSRDHRTSQCTLQTLAIPLDVVGVSRAEYWVDSPVAIQLGLPLKVCNIGTDGYPIPTNKAQLLSFRCEIKNQEAVLNHVANRLFATLDTTKPGFGEAQTWKFWDTTLIARTDGKSLDIEFLHAMDHFLRLRIKEIRSHSFTFTSLRQKQDYQRAIKDSSFTAQIMAATWEHIKADGIAKGYEKYQGMGHPFQPV